MVDGKCLAALRGADTNCLPLIIQGVDEPLVKRLASIRERQERSTEGES